MTPQAQLLATIGVALIALFGTWLTLRVNRPKVLAERESIVTAAALSLIEPLEKRIDDLERSEALTEDRIKELEYEAKLLRLWAMALYRQVDHMGGEPINFDQIEADAVRGRGLSTEPQEE